MTILRETTSNLIFLYQTCPICANHVKIDNDCPMCIVTFEHDYNWDLDLDYQFMQDEREPR